MLNLTVRNVLFYIYTIAKYCFYIHSEIEVDESIDYYEIVCQSNLLIIADAACL